MKKKMTKGQSIILILVLLSMVMPLFIPSACAQFISETQLTFNTHIDMDPCYSPDGTKIAFDTGGDAPFPYSIYVMDADGSNPGRRGTGSNPSFSPDGSKIAFDDGGIYIMNADGSGRRRLTDDPDDREPEFSPDGTRIVFSTERVPGQWRDIYSINVDGTDLTPVAGRPDSAEVTPSYSPDGTKIIFASNYDGDYEIYTRDLPFPPGGSPGGPWTQLTFDSDVGDWDYNPHFSPDGTKIAFESTVPDGPGLPPHEIFMMNADGSGETRYTFTGFNSNPRWSPDGTRIVFFSSRDGDFEIFVGNLVSVPIFIEVPASEPDGSFSTTIDAGADKGAPVTSYTVISTTNILSYSVEVSPDGMTITITGQLDDPNQEGQIVLEVDPAGEIITYEINIAAYVYLWRVETVPDTLGSAGGWTSLALDSYDNPHISYYGDYRSLMYVRFDGATWLAPEWADGYYLGTMNSLALDSDDNPHISYYDSDYDRLKYAKKVDTNWDVQIADQSYRWVGWCTSIALGSGGRPHISYTDAYAPYFLDLRHAWWDGIEWRQETVDSAGDVGFLDTSIALGKDGSVHISYYDNTNDDLKYAVKTKSGWSVGALDTTDDVGRYTSIALERTGEDPKQQTYWPHISYYDVTDGNLKYGRFRSWPFPPYVIWTSETVDSAGNVGLWTSLALDSDNYPHISYYDDDDDNLKYVRKTAGGWATPLTIDDTGDVGQYTSLALDSDDNPHISYYDATNGALKYATTASVNQPPVADANGPYTGTEGEPVAFDGSFSYDPDGTIVSYEWDFGDGNIGTGVTPTHTYTEADTYTVTLTVTDNRGATDTDTTTATISEPPNQPPVAEADGTYTGIVGEPVAFDGTGSYDPDGTIVSYEWDFGDGNIGTGVTPTHTYTEDGIYTITLTVTDDDGATDTDISWATIAVRVPAYLVVRGMDDRIYYRTYDSSWGDWNAVPRGRTGDSPGAAAHAGNLYMVVQGMDGRSLWFGWINLGDSSFTGWTRLGGATESAPTLVSYDDMLILVVRGLDDRVYYRFYDCVSDVWGDWTAVPDGATCDRPAAAVMGDELHMVVRGMDERSLWHGYVDIATSDFTGWRGLDGATESTPALICFEVGFEACLFLETRGLDDRIYHNVWYGGEWEGWVALLDGTTCDSPAIAMVGLELHIVVRDITGTALWHCYIDVESEIISDWTRIDGSTPSAPTLTN